jgi:hypothetical protein
MASPSYVPPPWSSGSPVAAYYAQGATPQQTSSASMVDIQGLTLLLPPADDYQVTALVTLCVPMSYANGTDTPGTNFCVTANGVQYGVGGYTYDSSAPQSSGRKPFTLVVQVPLGPDPTTVQGQWSSVRGATSYIDTFTSISALTCGGQQP